MELSLKVMGLRQDILVCAISFIIVQEGFDPKLRPKTHDFIIFTI